MVLESQLFTFRKDDKEVHIFPKKDIDTFFLKRKIMDLFNQNLFKIKVYDIPFCFLPEKIDNIIQTNGQHKKACNDCIFKPRCKGISEEYKDVFEARPLGNSPTEVSIEINVDTDKEKVFEIIDYMQMFNTPILNLKGNNPILYDDILEVLAYAKLKNRHIILNTEGVFKNVELMQKVVHFTDLIVFYLEGYNEESDKEITGKEIFNIKLKNIYLLSNKLKKKIMVKTKMSKTLIENFEIYDELLTKMNISQWVITRNNNVTKEDVLKISKQISNHNTFLSGYPVCFFPEHLRSLVKYNDNFNGVNTLFFNNENFQPSEDINLDLGTDLKISWEKNPYKELGKRDFADSKCVNCEMFMSCYSGSKVYTKDPFMI